MIADPAATPVTSPVVASIVATAGVAEVQDPPVTEDVKVEEPLAQIAVVPDMVPALGTAVTLTVAVVETFAQPPVPVTVYVITEVPAATPATAPVEASMVATLISLEDQALPASPLEVSVVEPLAQIAVVPEMVPALGTAVTVTIAVVDTFAQPPVPVTV
jgi:hypothetical protein